MISAVSLMGDGVEIQIGSPDPANLPAEADFQRWSAVALAGVQREGAELLIRLVDEEEIAALNKRFRHRDRPTNVLSFPYELLPGVETPFVGDIVICAPVVAREAREQGKETAAHWAHMVIHGILHLCGYDHMNDADAEEMEQLERKILSTMGFGDPYATG